MNVRNSLDDINPNRLNSFNACNISFQIQNYRDNLFSEPFLLLWLRLLIVTLFDVPNTLLGFLDML